MRILRTPEERFARLPFFPWAPHYLDEWGEAIARKALAAFGIPGRQPA